MVEPTAHNSLVAGSSPAGSTIFTQGVFIFSDDFSQRQRTHSMLI